MNQVRTLRDKNCKSTVGRRLNNSPAGRQKPIKKPQLKRLSRSGIRNSFFRQRKGSAVNVHPPRRKIQPRILSICIDPQQYNCPICLELLIYPTSLECGHTFCLPCIENFNKTVIKNQCSLCRADNATSFHEVNITLKKILQHICESNLSQPQKQEYIARKKNLEKQYATRGIKRRLNLNDQIKIKVKNYWVKGKIIKIQQKGGNIFYEVFTISDDEKYSINSKSINIKEEEIQKVKMQSNRIFPEDIFIENFPPLEHRLQPNHTYNIEQLLWEVSYYEPSEANHPIWSSRLSQPRPQESSNAVGQFDIEQYLV